MSNRRKNESPAPVVRSGGIGYRIVLAKAMLPLLHQYVTDSLREHGPGVEVGGMWVGEFEDGGRGPTFKLNGLVGAGPNAICAPESILFDGEYQARMLQAIRLQHPRSGNMGCFHRHPGSLDRCSEGDRAADAAAVSVSDTRALVFTIITLMPSEPDPLSICYRDLKIDFFLMAAANGFEYVHVRPTLVNLPIVQASPALAKLCLIRGPSTFFDVEALRRIGGLEKLSIRLVERGHGEGVWVEARPRRGAESLHIRVNEDGGLTALVGGGSAAPREFRGPWQEPKIGNHVWLSHLFVLMLSEAGMNEPVRYGWHRAGGGLIENKKRLVAEVRAMQEKFGDRAVLRYDKGLLYWEYTVEESGRRFPIEVRYPKHYPAKPPRLFSVLPLPHSPHQLVNNELCWVDQYSFRRDWNPARDTAAVCINAAHRWFACLLVYLTLGKWPEGADDQPVTHAT